MMYRSPWLLAALLGVFSTSVIAQQAPTNGQIRHQSDGSAEAWHAASKMWVTPLEFWNLYAESRGGLTWGKGADYPPYAQLSELDLFLVVLPSGPCLMEFFHTRWRRANDVRRWDPKFNEVGGCPHVFD